MTHEQTAMPSVAGEPFGVHENRLRGVYRTGTGTGFLLVPHAEIEPTEPEIILWDRWGQMGRQSHTPDIQHMPAEYAAKRLLAIFSGGEKITKTGWSPSPEHQAQQHDIIQRLARDIETISNQAKEANWDGEDSLPVAPETEMVAKKLVRLFPPISRVPDVSASPNGEIDLDWAVERHVMLTVSVCPPPEHYILFVANMEKSEFRGKEPWEDKLPQLIKCCFERMKGWL